MDVDEILSGLQKAVDEIDEEKARLIRLKENVNSMITKTELWFKEHGNELPEAGERK